MKTEDFNFDLPSDLIAQNPVSPRDSSRLMVLNRKDQSIKHYFFRDLPELLGPDNVLVFNKSKVIPARIKFRDKKRLLEILLIKAIDDDKWLAMVHPGKCFRIKDKLTLFNGVTCEVVDINESGFRSLKFSICGDDLRQFIQKRGIAPLPPYIKQSIASLNDYQTVYAEEEGSIAAPTAGLHFTNYIKDQLKENGVLLEYITLHVGPGTFLPVKSENIHDHKMHSEYYDIKAKTARSLNESLDAGKRLVAVGTTSVRVLESTFNQGFKADRGETGIFIYPGYEWKCVKGLLTNFHLPKSTLLMLVASFAGYEFIMRAYKEAVKGKYRFFSFGDSMLIL